MGFFLNDCHLELRLGKGEVHHHIVTDSHSKEASIVTVSTDWVAIKRTREVRFSCCPSHCK